MAVVQRFQLRPAVTALQRRLQQQVAERRILRQKGTVAVAAEDVFEMHAFGAVLAVVAVAHLDPGQCLDAFSEPGFPAVVFKSDQRALAAVRLPETVDGIADHPLLRPDGIQVQRAHKVTAHTLPGLIILSQHLISAADGQNTDAVLDGRAEGFRLPGTQIGQKHLLLKVLSAADQQQVAACEVELFADPHPLNGRVDASPGKAPAHAEDIAGITVQIQDVGIEMTDIQFHSVSVLPAYSQNSAPPQRRTISPLRASIAV